jgi:drug/metabolite transporter (DMT)-like permease
MIWLSVILSAVAQIFLKQGLSSLQKRRASVDPGSIIRGVVREAYLWLWGMCFVFATALWLLGLQKLDLSYAYPLVAFGYVLVNILSAFFFREKVDGSRWIAVAIIGMGVTLIAGS